jgi:hypothetical protein
MIHPERFRDKMEEQKDVDQATWVSRRLSQARVCRCTYSDSSLNSASSPTDGTARIELISCWTTTAFID